MLISRLRIVRYFIALSPRAKVAVMIGADAVFLPLCMVAANVLRHGSLNSVRGSNLSAEIALALMAIPVFAVAGLYRTVVRYIDLGVLASASGALAVVAALQYGIALLMPEGLLPRPAVISFGFIAFAYVVSSRFMARSLLRQGMRRPGRPRVRTAIYGAGDAGAQLAQTMQVSPEYKAVCFLDDRKELQGKTIIGLKVYSPDDLNEAVVRHDVSQIVVAIPSATAEQRRKLIERVDGAGLPVKILPGLVDLVDGNADVSSLREIDVADLLGRDPVPPEPTLFSRNIAGKVVLVTGAGGSIGSELCRQILSQKPQRLVLLDHSEYSLYSIDNELQAAAHIAEIVTCLGSVLDENLVRLILRKYQVQTIYHAAAYKHVPIVEANIQQGVRNNVFGSLTVAREAFAAGIETCVLISTDKAVRPTNVMGTTKRVAELIFQSYALRAPRTVFAMVRFGNVLGSSGSVVPLFRRQIKAGGPITITHPDIIRYFMLIPEAAQLVIQAGAMAHGGEVFVLDMGEPVRIADLARSMIHLSGLTERTAETPNGDIGITYVGLRPGEKMYEELLIGENVIPSMHPRVMCARERHIDPALLDKMLESLSHACEGNDKEAMIRQLKNLVPEFRSPQEVNAEAIAEKG